MARPVTCEILLLAAFHPELAPLRATLGDGMRGRVGGIDVAAGVVGIGLPMAAAGTAMLLAEMQPRAAILLGTCGAYAGSGLGIGDVVAARRVRLVALAAVDRLAQFPEPMSVVSQADTATADGLARAGARTADVATTLAITVDDPAADRIADSTGAGAEHLEAYGVATACAARGVPFGAALGVANLVGSRARDEWRAHHRAAAEAAAAVALRFIAGRG
jgi:nucleoside phosphorylase